MDTYAVLNLQDIIGPINNKTLDCSARGVISATRREYGCTKIVAQRILCFKNQSIFG